MYEIDQSEIESETGSSDDESNINELVIKFTNSLGEEKQLIICTFFFSLKLNTYKWNRC